MAVYSTDSDVAALNDAGKYAFGDGLYLQVQGARAKSWLYRYTLEGKQRWYGLGSVNGPQGLNLRTARVALGGARNEVERNGVDLVAQRRAARGVAKIYRPTGAVTFREAAAKCIEIRRRDWTNSKHAAQWESTLARYAYPHIGDLPVSSIDRDHIDSVLKPIWTLKRETANRVRARVEDVLAFAIGHGWRLESSGNPAELSKIFKVRMGGARNKRIRKHHAALPHAEAAIFLSALLAREGVAPKALAFTILTAARTNETIAARWTEIDFGRKVWTIPFTRMKQGVQHRVPLSDAAITILREMERRREGDFIFPGMRAGRPLSNMAMLKLAKSLNDEITTHGFRATFKTWADELGNAFSEAVKELALAHVNDDETKAAYGRSDMFEERRKLMDLWASYCMPAPSGDDGKTAGAVVSMVDRRQKRA